MFETARAYLDLVVFDVGGTLVQEADPTTPVADLVARPIGSVVQDLADLAGVVTLAAATDTATMVEADVRALLATVDLDRPLTAVVTSVEVGAAKPDPASLLVAMERTGVHDAGRVLFVGNTDRDRGAAEAAGCHYTEVGPDGAGRAVADWLKVRVGASVDAAVASLTEPSPEVAQAARDRHDQLTKPRGALGHLEEIGVRLAAMAGSERPADPYPAAVVVFAADHGVLQRGVSPWPQEVTAAMVAGFAAGTAAINTIASTSGLEVTVVDVGVATPVVTAPGVLHRRVAAGTADLASGPAMTVDQARAALDVGVDIVRSLVADGVRCVIGGDMGIGNTTPSAAIISALTGGDPRELTGRGTGIDDTTLDLKREIVAAAADRASGLDPLAVLAEVGGLEIAALAGLMIGGAEARVPVVVDGVIALAGAVVAHALAPAARSWWFAGHRSTEPAATAALTHLDLRPVLDLDLRLGEGTGAALAYPVMRAAAAVLRDMATLEEAGIG